MRIIAGQFRSRKLHSLRGAEIRPTSDRLRETLFDVLTAGNPGALENSVWVDFFAGTGAVGIEALSRGAARVYFVESSRAAAELIRKNLQPLEVNGKFQVLMQEVERAISALDQQQVNADFIFLDPPYHLGEIYGAALTRLGNSPLAKRALVIVEHQKKFDPGEKFASLARIRLLKRGDAALSFYRQQSSQ